MIHSKTKHMKNNILILLLDGSRGIYIPKIFAEYYPDQLSEEDQKILSDPDNDLYWEVWDEILGKPFFIGGIEYNLHQDGDLWALKNGYIFNEDGSIVNLESGEILEP